MSAAAHASQTTETTSLCLHATCISFASRGLLILGASGSGKSALALDLISRGAALVADDQTRLLLGPEGLRACAPEAIAGRIEARGIGLLRLESAQATRITYAIDLDQIETARLPTKQFVTYLGQRVPLLHRIEGPHLAPTLMLLLKGATLER